MRKSFVFLFVAVIVIICSSWLVRRQAGGESLRELYQRPVGEWPRPDIDSGIVWSELADLPKDSSYLLWDNNDTVKLGRLLFFDPRLSRSGQISCSSCHDPDLAWQDGRKVSLGNDHLQGTRNTPSLFNVFIQKELFWDGRSGTLGNQALQPLSQHHEMDMDLGRLPKKIGSVKGYRPLFEQAYQNKKITLDKIITAIVAFEATIHTRRTRFDAFVKGDYKQLNDQEIEGLHLFRTKARCMNCHNGTYFTDRDYHNIGLTYYGRKYQDLGRYTVTHNPDDVGKFKTPSLRGTMLTHPWMHNGLFDNIEGVINMYNSGMHQLDNKVSRVEDPLYPHTDPILRPLGLTKTEKESLIAFLRTLSGVEYKMPRPELPK